MEGKKIIKKYSEWIIYILFLVGAIFHPIQQFRELMILLTPLTLFITTLIILINLFDEDKKIFLWLLIVFVLTMIIEIIGVKTKIIFGNYVYGNTLGFKVFDVPLIIGFNWALIILGGIQLTKKIFSNKILFILFASIVTVVFDFILEPVAINLDYWSWNGNLIPFQNYIGWFIISLISVLIYSKLNIHIKNSLLMKYFITQFLFFLILRILMKV